MQLWVGRRCNALSRASFQLKLTTGGGSSVTVTDNDFGDTAWGEGAYFILWYARELDINVTTVSKPVLPASTPTLMINSLNATSSVADSLTITLTDPAWRLPRCRLRSKLSSVARPRPLAPVHQPRSPSTMQTLSLREQPLPVVLGPSAACNKELGPWNRVLPQVADDPGYNFSTMRQDQYQD